MDIPYQISPGSYSYRNALYPYARLVDAQGKPIAVPRDFDLDFANATPSQLLDWHYRPLEEVGFANNSIKTQYALFNLSANLRMTSWLSGEIKFQYGYQLGTNRNYYSQQTYFARNLINQYTNPSTFTKSIPSGVY